MRIIVLILPFLLNVNLFAQDSLSSSKKLLIGIDLARTVSHFMYFENYIPLHINANILAGNRWSIPAEGGIVSSKNNIHLNGNHNVEQFSVYIKSGIEFNIYKTDGQTDTYIGLTSGVSYVDEQRVVHINGNLYGDYTEVIYDQTNFYQVTSIYLGTRTSLEELNNLNAFQIKGLKNTFMEFNIGLSYSGNKNFPKPRYFIPGIGRPYEQVNFIIAPNLSCSLLYRI